MKCSCHLSSSSPSNIFPTAAVIRLQSGNRALCAFGGCSHLGPLLPDVQRAALKQQFPDTTVRPLAREPTLYLGPETGSDIEQ